MSKGGKEHYILDNTWEHARTRLQLLEDYNASYTFTYLEQLDIPPGLTCLNAGAGLGGVTRWLANKAGDEGHVYALDAVPVFLQDIDLPNVSVLEQDLVLDDLPRHHYDLIFSRDVLMHIPERKAVIHKMAAALKPGGRLIIEDLGVMPGAIRFQDFSPDPDINRTTAYFYEMMEEKKHQSFSSAFENPHTFREAGLVEISAHSRTDYQNGNGDEGKLMALSLLQLKPLCLQEGMDEKLFDQSRERYLNPDAHWWSMSHTVTMGIKPAD